MAELTPEIVERKREAEQRAVSRRHALRATVRSARERLTSSTGQSRAFDYQLLKLYAETRTGAAVVSALFTSCIAITLLLFVPPYNVVFWISLAAFGTLLNLIVCRRFLRSPTEVAQDKTATWRARFAVAELIQAMCWVTIVIFATGHQGDRLHLFLLFAIMFQVGMTTVLCATVMSTVYAVMVPAIPAIAFLAVFETDVSRTILILMSLGAFVFYVVLAQRLNQNACETLASRAEKDALIAELEEAHSKSNEARRRAEEANLAKSRFLATMSHELRTPLNAILGFSEVMKNELFGAHSAPQYRDYSADVHASGQHLLNIINEILDLSRVEAGRYELQEEPIDLAALVDDCRHMLDLRARNRSLTVRDMIEPDLPKLWADERALRQITINLLANAIKFTPQGGEIVIKVGWTTSGGQYVSIADNGPGIPEDEIPTVLTSFGRGTFAIKTAEQGTGLGLPIVKGLVELHGGVFTLKSRLRVGTEVIVVFPPDRVVNGEGEPSVAA